jgi:hypothetical protein
MPTGLVDDVIKAMGIKAPPGGDQEPEPEPESQPELELELEPEPPELDAWLVQVDLAQYGPQIKEYGYDKLKALLVATEEDIVEMTADPDLKMKKPHRRLFVAEWKELLASRS